MTQEMKTDKYYRTFSKPYIYMSHTCHIHAFGEWLMTHGHLCRIGKCLVECVLTSFLRINGQLTHDGGVCRTLCRVFFPSPVDSCLGSLLAKYPMVFARRQLGFESSHVKVKAQFIPWGAMSLRCLDVDYIILVMAWWES